MKIVDLNLGPECEVDVELAGGNLTFKLDEKTPGVTGSVNVVVPVGYFMDQLAVKLNSNMATALLNGLKAIVSAA